jgi:NAD(P)-dependent dehydrogenase (short-subunit alcohol dehydrogenase family)
MTVNVEAPALLTRAFAEAGGPGLVVNIIDQRVWKPTPRFLSYSTSKAALWWLTRTMAQALAPRIRVVALAPGPVLKAASQEAEDFERLVGTIPLRRSPDLAEFGRSIRFLLETESITGQMIALDGGQHLSWETPDALVRE